MGKRRTIRDIKARKEEQKRRAKRRKRAMFLIGEVLVFVLLCAVWYGIKTTDKFQIQRFAEGEIQVNEGVTKKGYTTLALFGGDSRDGILDAGTHTDAIMIVSIHNETKKVKVVSIFRDTITEQMDGQMKKANNAYFVGGPKEAINMLNKNFDLDIQGYVTVDFAALADTVDLLGGIEVNVSKAEAKEMNRYIKETSRVVGKESEKVKKGLQNLDGVQAVTYARIRKNVGGDYQRVDRQRLVVEKIIKKTKQTDLSTIHDIVGTVSQQISTSLTLSEMLNLATDVAKYELNGSKGFPFDYVDGRVDNVGSVVIPTDLKSNVIQLHGFLYGDLEYEVSQTVQYISENIQLITGS